MDDCTLPVEIELPDMSFTINGNPHNVPCVFQIWKKKETNRIIPVKLKPKNFKFVKKSEEHDVSFRRVGVYAGKIDKDTEKNLVTKVRVMYTGLPSWLKTTVDEDNKLSLRLNNLLQSLQEYILLFVLYFLVFALKL